MKVSWVCTFFFSTYLAGVPSVLSRSYYVQFSLIGQEIDVTVTRTTQKIFQIININVCRQGATLIWQRGTELFGRQQNTELYGETRSEVYLEVLRWPPWETSGQKGDIEKGKAIKMIFGQLRNKVEQMKKTANLLTNWKWFNLFDAPPLKNVIVPYLQRKSCIELK